MAVAKDNDCYTSITAKRRTRTSKPRRLRDPAFIEDPSSIRTLDSRPLRLLTSFVLLFPVMSILLFTLILRVYVNELSVSALSTCGASYDVGPIVYDLTGTLTALYC